MKTRTRRSVVVVGGGIAGLSTAWRLAAAGCAVTVLDAATHFSSGGGGTWASAGMICAQLEMHGAPPALAAFALSARAAWPAFAADIQRASDVNPGFVECGALHVKFDGDLETAASPGLEWLGQGSALAIEPCLSNDVTGGLWAPREAMVDPRWTALALTTACLKTAVTVSSSIRVDRILESGGRATGVRANGVDIQFDHVVLAAGAWTGALLEKSRLPGPNVRPVKGQVLSLLGKASGGPRRLIWSDEVYVAPHLDGRIIIGATQEETGFDTSLDDERIDALKAAAIRAIPMLADLVEMERTYGFRPASDDSLPVIGGIGLEGLTIASGQFRNGIMFAPLVADAAAQHVLGNRLPDIALPFSAQRFVNEAA